MRHFYGGKKLSDINPSTMPGPGDLWKPPEDEPMFTCEVCGYEFSYNPKDYMDADEDGICGCSPPTICEGCKWLEDK